MTTSYNTLFSLRTIWPLICQKYFQEENSGRDIHSPKIALILGEWMSRIQERYTKERSLLIKGGLFDEDFVLVHR